MDLEPSWSEAETQERNPCVSCGACCAYFRVQFYWREANREDHRPSVPAGHFEELDDRYRCMKGTAKKHRPQCVGLKGRIGRDAHCSIYALRPSPCRAFSASYENGVHQPRCDEARRAHGLRPLTLRDWLPEED